MATDEPNHIAKAAAEGASEAPRVAVTVAPAPPLTAAKVRAASALPKPKFSWRAVGENALVAAVVSAFVSGGVLVWGEVRLENSKQYVSAVVQQKDKFDNSQTNIFTQITLYTGKLFGTPPQSAEKEKDQLQSAIISTLLQLNNLKDELPRSDHPLLDRYAGELQNLSKQLRDVRTSTDLGPIYVTSQNLLVLHDQINERVNSNLDVGIFSGRRS